ncbi:MAG: PmoA family protein [Bryobacterales bacterium]|nr:PmoA family protein [Bryobacterales bacterium]
MPTRRELLGAAAFAFQGGRLRLSHFEGEKVVVSSGATTLLEYRYTTARPKSYIHPLYVDGRPVTLDGPKDHVHHRGLMVAWSEVNGIDFWGEVNPARHGQIVHQRFERLRDGRVAELVSLNHWVAEGKRLLVERRTVRVGLPEGGTWLEWITELTAADEPVKLAAGQHVYNGLGIRVVPEMDGGRVLNSNGTATIEKANGEPAKWCAYTGAGLGVAFFDHPANPRHPNAFFVMNKAFGYMSAAPTFREPFQLARGESIRFRWGVLAFGGEPKAEALDRRFQSWSKEKP